MKMMKLRLCSIHNGGEATQGRREGCLSTQASKPCYLQMVRITVSNIIPFSLVDCINIINNIYS